MDSIESTILSVSMNPDSPGEQLPPTSPLAFVPPPQMYQQAPSLTPPISAPSMEAEVPILGTEEGLIQPPAPVVMEPTAIMEEPMMMVEEPMMVVPVAAPIPVPVPVHVNVHEPEFIETEAIEMAPVVNSETAQVEPVLGEIEASVETPSGKRPRTKKPKSASKASKSKAKKEADSWMDGEALSSAGADTNDEVYPVVT